MANNIIGGQPNAVIATTGITTSFVDAGITALNTSVIYKVGNVYQSYVPGRPINSITAFESEQGYLIIAIIDFDLSIYVESQLNLNTMVTNLPYTPEIPFRNVNAVMQKVVTGPITFTPDTTESIAGSGVILSIEADGVNEPVFTGFYKLSASDVYNNTVGRRHLISFLKTLDGDYVYSISQVRTRDLVAPIITSRITFANNQIKYVFAEPVTGSTGYSFKKNTVTVAHTFIGISANTMTFEIGTFAPGDVITGSYTPGNTVDIGNNPLAGFTDAAITNNLDYQFLNFSVNTALSQTGNNWLSTDGSAPGTYIATGLASTHFAAGQDGVVLFQFNSSANYDALLALNTTNENAGYANYESFIQAQSAGLTDNVASGPFPLTAGNYYGYRRVAGAIDIVEANSSGVITTSLNTVTPFTGSTGNLYININLDAGKRIDNVKGNNLV